MRTHTGRFVLHAERLGVITDACGRRRERFVIVLQVFGGAVLGAAVGSCWEKGPVICRQP
jgi:hypothetical protein